MSFLIIGRAVRFTFTMNTCLYWLQAIKLGSSSIYLLYNVSLNFPKENIDKVK